MRRIHLFLLSGLIAGCAVAPKQPPEPSSSQDSSPVPDPSAVPESSNVPEPTSSVGSGGSVSTSPTPKPPVYDGENTWGEADMNATIPLVSRRYRLSASYVPQRTGSWGLTPETNQAVLKLIAAATADGVKMVVRSGYRSYQAQKDGYESALRSYSSVEEAKRYNAPPGASEHQTGLAVDMWDGRNRGHAFRGTPTDHWLAEHAYRFGFIIRYPKGKESVTGYADEPWHLRYVGIETSQKFAVNKTLTLEEYLGVA